MGTAMLLLGSFAGGFGMCVGVGVGVGCMLVGGLVVGCEGVEGFYVSRGRGEGE